MKEKTACTTHKSFVRVLALVLPLILCLGLLAGCGKETNGGAGSSAGETAVKSIVVTVVHGDGNSKEFAIETQQDMLGAALLDEELIAGDDSEYGLFVTTVDGETADSGKQEWWCLTIGGEQATTGVDSTPLEEGGQYELTLMAGY